MVKKIVTKNSNSVIWKQNNPVFRQILDEMPQIVFVLQDLDFVYFNHLAKMFFNPTNTTIADYISEKEMQLFTEVAKQNKAGNFELNISIPDKHRLVFFVQSVPFVIDKQTYTVNYLKDVTAYKKEEDILLKAKQKAEDTDRQKSSFLANVSHEIRTPLNAIVGFSQLLSEDHIKKNDKQKYAQLIETNSYQLLNLIEDISDFVKMESGEMTINKSDFNIKPWMEDIYSQFSERMLQLEPDLELRLNFPKTQSKILINSDKQRLTQVFVNLINNALKFTKKGYIEMGVSDEKEDELCFYVLDTGIGIQKQKQRLIFDRYQQIQDEKNLKTKGAGLGLAISKHIVELLGGEITVNSKLGKGSVFKFTIPNLTEQNNSPIGRINKNTPAYLDWSNRTILLAEDEASNYLFIKEVLKRTKVNLIWVENGKEALAFLKNQPSIDLILLDIRMPIMDGYETIAQIKKIGVNVPVIAQTAYAMVEDKDQMLAAGFDAYLSKPIQINVLINTLSRFIYG